MSVKRPPSPPATSVPVAPTHPAARTGVGFGKWDAGDGFTARPGVCASVRTRV